MFDLRVALSIKLQYLNDQWTEEERTDRQTDRLVVPSQAPELTSGVRVASTGRRHAVRLTTSHVVIGVVVRSKYKARA